LVATSHYELLEVEPKANAAELRRAFRQLSKRYHPDTTSLPEAEAREAFRQLQQAYLTLSDPERRRAYDAGLLAVRPAAPQPQPVQPRRMAVPQTVRRPLSGGEWFALLLLALAVLFSLVLGVGLAWARGTALVSTPSWWPPSGQTAQLIAPAAPDDGPAAAPGAALQPPSAGPGELAAAAGGGAAGGELLPVGPADAGVER
jgi:DnaJ domain